VRLKKSQIKESVRGTWFAKKRKGKTRDTMRNEREWLPLTA
jgi:hypothetical protein